MISTGFLKVFMVKIDFKLFILHGRLIIEKLKVNEASKSNLSDHFFGLVGGY